MSDEPRSTAWQCCYDAFGRPERAPRSPAAAADAASERRDAAHP